MRPIDRCSEQPSTKLTFGERAATESDTRKADHRLGFPNATPNHFVVSPGGGKVNDVDWVVNA
jgi:hypothetical protein